MGAAVGAALEVVNRAARSQLYTWVESSASRRGLQIARRGLQETDTIILQLLLALPAASAMSAGVARSGRQLTVTVYSDFA